MKIILYSRSTCGPCKTLKYLLNKRGVSFEEREPDDSVWIVPTILIGQERIEGYYPVRVLEALALQTA